MSFLSVFDVLSPVINKVINLIPDPEQKLKAQMELMASLQAWDKQQTEINAVEAANSNLFVSGARPFILWVCGFAVAYKFIIQPFLIFIIAVFQVDFDAKLLPNIDWAELSSLMFGMLGLAGARTFEKVKGVA